MLIHKISRSNFRIKELWIVRRVCLEHKTQQKAAISFVESLPEKQIFPLHYHSDKRTRSAFLNNLYLSFKKTNETLER
jgi:hypothetical protein